MLPGMEVQFDPPGSSDDYSSHSEDIDDQVLESGNNAALLYLEDLERAGTLDANFLEQYVHWGEFTIHRAYHNTLRFLAAVYCGTGSSRRTAQAVLNFMHTLEGKSYSIPRTVAGCWKQVESLHARLTSKRTLVHCSYPVPEEIQALMMNPAPTVVMEFVDPTEALARLIVCSPLCKDPNNVAFFPENSEYLDDYCNGARMKRVHAAIPAGTAALTAVLFFDEINQDKKGFNTGEGAIIVGGFFRKEARESTYAKSSLGSFPGVKFPKVRLAFVWI